METLCTGRLIKANEPEGEQGWSRLSAASPDHADQISVWFPEQRSKVCGVSVFVSVTPPRSDQASASCAPKLNQRVFFSRVLWGVFFFFMIKSVNRKGTFAICRSATVNNYGWLISMCLRRGVLPYVVRSLQKENKSRMMFFSSDWKQARRQRTLLFFSVTGLENIFWHHILIKQLQTWFIIIIF